MDMQAGTQGAQDRRKAGHFVPKNGRHRSGYTGVNLKPAIRARLLGVCDDQGITITDAVEAALTEWLARQDAGKAREMATAA